MNNIYKESTDKTPEVNFVFEKGLMEIKGRSIPENSLKFYEELLEWVEKYATNANLETNVNIQLEYFNTSSSKCLLDLFKKMENIGSTVNINWYYEEDDEDMLEAGEDYDAIINIPFKMIEVHELS